VGDKPALLEASAERHLLRLPQLSSATRLIRASVSPHRGTGTVASRAARRGVLWPRAAPEVRPRHVARARCRSGDDRCIDRACLDCTHGSRPTRSVTPLRLISRLSPRRIWAFRPAVNSAALYSSSARRISGTHSPVRTLKALKEPPSCHTVQGIPRASACSRTRRSQRSRDAGSARSMTANSPR